MSRWIELQDGAVLNLHDDGDALSDRIVRERDYFERDILDYIRENYPIHNIILDVGANVGNHTVYFARYLDCQAIVAFEPVVENYTLLQDNVREYERIFTRQCAVGDSTHPVKLYINKTNMGACTIVPDGTQEALQIRLDDLFINTVSLIKIDVEWYEPEVLAGAKNLIEEDKPLVLIEDTDRKYGSLFPDYYRLLKEWPDHNTYLYGVPHAHAIT